MPSRARPSSGAPRITVVDDDELICEVIRDALTATLGATVQCLPKASSSLAEAVATRPDLLIVDVWIIDGPEARGWGLIRAVRRTSALRKMPILIVSADPHGLRNHAAEIAALGCTQLLLKPFTLEALERFVQDLLRSPDVAPDLSVLAMPAREAVSGGAAAG